MFRSFKPQTSGQIVRLLLRKRLITNTKQYRTFSEWKTKKSTNTQQQQEEEALKDETQKKEEEHQNKVMPTLWNMISKIF